MYKKSKKKNLMLITHDVAIGGLQQVIVNICRTIDRNIFNVTVLCLRDFGEYLPEIEALGIKVVLVSETIKTDYFLFYKIAKILRAYDIDIVHTHNTQPFIDGTLAALFARVKTIIHTDHARSFPDKRRYMFAEWLMAHFAYKVVGVSDHTTENLANYEHIPKKKLTTIVNGIDDTKFKVHVDRDKKLIELGLRKNGPIIGLGVRLSKQKGLTYLIQAMPSIIKCFKDISLLIAGKGALLKSLKREVCELGIDNYVFFVGPRIDMHEIIQLLDIYVLPSLWEGLPMVLLEAMASGCPVVATNVGGNASVINNRENGVLVEPGNPNLLASEIIDLLSSAEKMKKYGVNGRKTYERHFSAEVMTKKYEKLYLRQN